MKWHRCAFPEQLPPPQLAKYALLLILATLLLLTTAWASAATTPDLHACTAWATQYSDSAGGPLALQGTAVGGNTVFFYLKVVNPGGDREGFKVTLTGGTSAWDVSMLDAEGADITSEVTGADGWAADFAAGGCEDMTLRVLPAPTLTTPDPLVLTLTAANEAGGPPSPAATATFTVDARLPVTPVAGTPVAGFRPDLQMARADLTNWIGVGVYGTPDSTGQMQLLYPETGTPATSYLCVSNNGDTAGTAVITAQPPSTTNWTLTYRDSDGTDVTSQVVSASGWSMPLTPGQVAPFTVTILGAESSGSAGTNPSVRVTVTVADAANPAVCDSGLIQVAPLPVSLGGQFALATTGASMGVSVITPVSTPACTPAPATPTPTCVHTCPTSPAPSLSGDEIKPLSDIYVDCGADDELTAWTSEAKTKINSCGDCACLKYESHCTSDELIFLGEWTPTATASALAFLYDGTLTNYGPSSDSISIFIDGICYPINATTTGTPAEEARWFHVVQFPTLTLGTPHLVYIYYTRPNGSSCNGCHGCTLLGYSGGGTMSTAPALTMAIITPQTTDLLPPSTSVTVKGFCTPETGGGTPTVTFYDNDTTIIGTLNADSEVYSITWTPATTGTHDLKMEAVSGMTTATATITAHVGTAIILVRAKKSAGVTPDDFSNWASIAAGGIDSNAHMAEVQITTEPPTPNVVIPLTMTGGEGFLTSAKLSLPKMTESTGTLSGTLISSDAAEIVTLAIQGGTATVSMDENWDGGDNIWQLDPSYLDTVNTCAVNLLHHGEPVNGHEIHFIVDHVIYTDTNGNDVTITDPDAIADYAYFDPSVDTSDYDGIARSVLSSVSTVTWVSARIYDATVINLLLPNTNAFFSAPSNPGVWNGGITGNHAYRPGSMYLDTQHLKDAKVYPGQDVTFAAPFVVVDKELDDNGVWQNILPPVGWCNFTVNIKLVNAKFRDNTTEKNIQLQMAGDGYAILGPGNVIIDTGWDGAIGNPVTITFTVTDNTTIPSANLAAGYYPDSLQNPPGSFTLTWIEGREDGSDLPTTCVPKEQSPGTIGKFSPITKDGQGIVVTYKFGGPDPTINYNFSGIMINENFLTITSNVCSYWVKQSFKDLHSDVLLDDEGIWNILFKPGITTAGVINSDNEINDHHTWGSTNELNEALLNNWLIPAKKTNEFIYYSLTQQYVAGAGVGMHYPVSNITYVRQSSTTGGSPLHYIGINVVDPRSP